MEERKELNPSELRIGNYVNMFIGMEKDGARYGPRPIIFGWEIDEVEKLYAIPLTEELLLKCGFIFNTEDDNFYFSRQIGNNLNLTCDKNYENWGIALGWKGEGAHVWKQPKYLHEIQNLIYYQTNEEIEIEF